jgi:K+-sensing histidine kinase KdpD
MSSETAAAEMRASIFQKLLPPGPAPVYEALRVTAIALVLLGALTGALVMVQNFINVETVTIIYLIAVLYAATYGGLLPAIITALAAIGAAAFFFYPPIYDFRVYNPIHLVDMALFIIVAVVTGQLAMGARKAKMREETDALREALIGSVSHELRSPLSSIIGSASILARSPEITTNPKMLPLVQGMQEEADRLNQHIQNLLDSTRISSEGVRPHLEWVDPGDIVNAAIEKKSKVLAGHQVDVSVADDLPLVHTDPVLIKRALGHVIENAAKYSPPGSPIAVGAGLSDGAIVLTVKDRGVGLTGEESEQMWQRFYRSPRHRNTTDGSGLGLWITRSLAEACGGRVEASSSGVGRGATVSVLLPASLTAQPQHEVAD